MSKRRRELDRIDLKILECLQADGRLANAVLARRVNLTPTPCLERVRRLEKLGYIKGYRAVLDPHRLGAGLLVFVEITLNRNAPELFREFRQAVQKFPEVLDCHLVSGNFDYLIKARVRDMEAYRRLLGDRILPLPGVNASRSYVVMEEIKETLAIPLSG